MEKKYIVIAIILVIFSTIIIGDYYALFGVRQVNKADFIEMNFKTIDEESGRRIAEVKARCFQKGNKNACTQRDSGKRGIVSVNIPVQKIITKSFLFDHDVKLSDDTESKIHIMFFVQDYANTVETIYMDELLDLATSELSVQMPKSISYEQSD